MRPVCQDIFVEPGMTAEDLERPGVRRGNCLQAAFASLFELPLEAVPHFVAEDDWWGCLERWLAARGLLPVWVPHSDVIPWGIPYLATGVSPRGEFKHVVIEQNGELIHDPHPEGTGLKGHRTGVYLLVSLANA